MIQHSCLWVSTQGKWKWYRRDIYTPVFTAALFTTVFYYWYVCSVGPILWSLLAVLVPENYELRDQIPFIPFLGKELCLEVYTESCTYQEMPSVAWLSLFPAESWEITLCQSFPHPLCPAQLSKFKADNQVNKKCQNTASLSGLSTFSFTGAWVPGFSLQDLYDDMCSISHEVSL